jgi:hypothetical protein
MTDYILKFKKMPFSNRNKTLKNNSQYGSETTRNINRALPSATAASVNDSSEPTHKMNYRNPTLDNV